MNHPPTATAIGQKRRRIARLSFRRRASLEMAQGRYESCPLLVVMIAWGLRMQTAAGKRAEVQRILRGLLEPTRVRGGCLACHLYEDVEDPDVLALVQEWASADDLERYLRSEDRRKLVAVMELASRRPEIWVDTIVMREGLERLATLMGSNAKGEGHD
jgi:quinol monooxygenase YgiN